MPSKRFSFGHRREPSDGASPGQQPLPPANPSYSASYGPPPPPFSFAPWQHGEMNRLSQVGPGSFDTPMPDAHAGAQPPGQGHPAFGNNTREG